MAGKYRANGLPSFTSRGKPSGRRSMGVPTFAGTPLTVDGITREAMGSTSLLGASVPKGLLAASVGASHGAAANDLTNSQANAQIDIAAVLAQLNAVAISRELRAAARNAEGVANSSTRTEVESPRLMAHGRGPRVAVMGMVAGDLNRVVAMFERYGYTIGRAFVPSQLNVMDHYSYWQADEPTILGTLPQSARDSISAAFERGVTVWDSVAEIGTQPANTPLDGISY